MLTYYSKDIFPFILTTVPIFFVIPMGSERKVVHSQVSHHRSCSVLVIYTNIINQHIFCIPINPLPPITQSPER